MTIVEPTRPPEDSMGLSQCLVIAMSVAAGIALANVYYNQPMLGIMEQASPGGTTSLVPTAAQLGYAAGLFLLGALIGRKRLIVWQFVALAAARALVALSPTALLVVLASFLVGAAATVAQQVVPLAAHLSAPERHGHGGAALRHLA